MTHGRASLLEKENYHYNGYWLLICSFVHVASASLTKKDEPVKLADEPEGIFSEMDRQTAMLWKRPGRRLPLSAPRWQYRAGM